MTGVTIPKEIWQTAMNTPNNQTSKHVIPHWREWDDEMMATFTEICGDLMKRYGYLKATFDN